MKTLYNILNTVTDFIFPPVCLVCSQDLFEENALTLHNRRYLLCLNCVPEGSTRRQPTNDETLCIQCGVDAGLMLGTNRCLACTIAPPEFRHLRSLWPYNNPHAEDIIKAFKYGRKFALATPLAALIAKAICEEHIFPTVDWHLIVPLPSSPHLVKERRFSHTSVLSSHISKLLRLNWSGTVLVSSRARLPQASLTADERSENVAGAFNCKSTLVNCKNILLIDDTITTGASVEQAVIALLNSGARKVDVLTLARSSRFSRNRLASRLSDETGKITLNSAKANLGKGAFRLPEGH